MSLRDVADGAGIALGNLTYYFSTKDELLNIMLNETHADYADAHIKQLHNTDLTPLERLLDTVNFYIVNGREASRYFFQGWGYAASNKSAKKTINRLYSSIGKLMYHLVSEANPALTEKQVYLAVLQIFSLEEGLKLFAGLEIDFYASDEEVDRTVRELTTSIVMGGAAPSNPS